MDMDLYNFLTRNKVFYPKNCADESQGRHCQEQKIDQKTFKQTRIQAFYVMESDNCFGNVSVVGSWWWKTRTMSSALSFACLGLNSVAKSNEIIQDTESLQFPGCNVIPIDPINCLLAVHWERATWVDVVDETLQWLARTCSTADRCKFCVALSQDTFAKCTNERGKTVWKACNRDALTKPSEWLSTSRQLDMQPNVFECYLNTWDAEKLSLEIQDVAWNMFRANILIHVQVSQEHLRNWW